MTKNELVLANHPFLREFSPYHLEALAENAMQRRFEPDEIIFREGDPANRFYLILSGDVKVYWRDQNGEMAPLERLGANEVLGWSWLFPPFHTRLEARAIGPVETIFFYGTRLRDMAERDPEFGYQLMNRAAGVMLQRLNAAHREVLALRRETTAGESASVPRWNKFRAAI